MAVFAHNEELKREIDTLIAENEELKQLVQLLRENQELKSILCNQYNENTFLSALDSPDVKQASMERIVGQIVFQLDRRILSSIFPDHVRLYDFTVSNIPEKITQGGNRSFPPLAPLNEEQLKDMIERLTDIMNQLKPLGYDPNVHPTFTEYMVNTYGILRERPDTTDAEGDTFNNPEYLQNVVSAVVPSEKLEDCRILLACLSHLSQADGKPLFIW